MYLWWFDDNPKKAASIKIAEAVAAYIERAHTRPNIVLVNADDRVEVNGVAVRTESYIRRHNFWVGWEDPAQAA
jgi:hypothetical protein